MGLFEGFSLLYFLFDLVNGEKRQNLSMVFESLQVASHKWLHVTATKSRAGKNCCWIGSKGSPSSAITAVPNALNCKSYPFLECNTSWLCLSDWNELTEQSSLRKQLSQWWENGLSLQPGWESNQAPSPNSARKTLVQQGTKVPLANSAVVTPSVLGVAVLDKDVFRYASGFRMRTSTKERFPSPGLQNVLWNDKWKLSHGSNFKYSNSSDVFSATKVTLFWQQSFAQIFPAPMMEGPKVSSSPGSN